jgi:hypothetical protein
VVFEAKDLKPMSSRDFRYIENGALRWDRGRGVRLGYPKLESAVWQAKIPLKGV